LRSKFEGQDQEREDTDNQLASLRAENEALLEILHKLKAKTSENKTEQTKELVRLRADNLTLQKSLSQLQTKLETHTADQANLAKKMKQVAQLLQRSDANGESKHIEALLQDYSARQSSQRNALGPLVESFANETISRLEEEIASQRRHINHLEQGNFDAQRVKSRLVEADRETQDLKETLRRKTAQYDAEIG
jgi:chromosome segregation ATPase